MTLELSIDSPFSNVLELKDQKDEIDDDFSKTQKKDYIKQYKIEKILQNYEISSSLDEKDLKNVYMNLESVKSKMKENLSSELSKLHELFEKNTKDLNFFKEEIISLNINKNNLRVSKSHEKYNSEISKLAENYMIYVKSINWHQKKQLKRSVKDIDIKIKIYLADGNIEQAVNSFNILKTHVIELGEDVDDILSKSMIRIDSYIRPLILKSFENMNQHEIQTLSAHCYKFDEHKSIQIIYDEYVKEKFHNLLISGLELPDLLYEINQIYNDEIEWLKFLTFLNVSETFSRVSIQNMDNFSKIVSEFKEKTLFHSKDFISFSEEYTNKVEIYNEIKSFITKIELSEHSLNDSKKFYRIGMELLDNFDAHLTSIIFSNLEYLGKKYENLDDLILAIEDINSKIFKEIKRFLRCIDNIEIYYKFGSVIYHYQRKVYRLLLECYKNIFITQIRSIKLLTSDIFWRQQSKIYSNSCKINHIIKKFNDILYFVHNDITNDQERHDIYFNVFKRPEESESQTSLRLYMRSKESGLESHNEIISCIIKTPVDIFSEYITQIIDDKKSLTLSSEIDSRIIQIGEVLLHLPMFFDSILEEHGPENLRYITGDDKISNILHADEWLEYAVKIYAREAIDVIKFKINVLNQQEKSRSYLTKIMNTLNCQNLI